MTFTAMTSRATAATRGRIAATSPSASSAIRDADLIGLQEPTADQWNEIATPLDGYTPFGVWRDEWHDPEARSGLFRFRLIGSAARRRHASRSGPGNARPRTFASPRSRDPKKRGMAETIPLRRHASNYAGMLIGPPPAAGGGTAP